MRLGEWLLSRGAVSKTQLEAALKRQQASGSRLGEELASESGLSLPAIYQAVAAMRGLEYADLLASPPDAALLKPEHLHAYIERRALPWKRQEGVLIVATSEPGEDVIAWAEAAYGTPCRLAVASPYDIRRAVEAQFSGVLDEESRLHLHRLSPERSARQTMIPSQRRVILALLLGAAGVFFLTPHWTLVWILIALQALYASTMLFKLLVFREGMKPAPKEPLPAPEDLPIYTLLVPLYREAASLPHLLDALQRIDYPQSRLDIKLLMEEDDLETWRTAIALRPARNVELIRVPHSEPRTKPKALNYGLSFARGDYVTVYDAEDEPETLQLKKAVAAFRAAPEDVACLQARLQYYNASANWLTRWFALEYGALFETTLPGMQRLHLPLLLGDTSNHLPKNRLKEIGAWDPFNVTEDADLGVRLARLGLKTEMLNSATLEEAPEQLALWLRQRSRWVKGYMQTWLVHMREPVRLWRKLGAQSFFGLHYFVGMAPLTFITAPLVWIVWLMLFLWPGGLRTAFPAWFLWLSWLNLALHFGLHWLQGFYAMPRVPGYNEKPWRFRISAATYPFYWALHSAASYRALWQLLRRPHFWDKTEHGLAKRRDLA